MKISIIGAGAVGGFFGAKLALAGLDVSFLARGKNLEFLKKYGLKFETEGKIYTIKDAIFTDNPKELGEPDYILFTVKSYDTKQTAEQIRSILGENTQVITPQNGINNDLILSEILGKEKVIPGMAKIGVSMPKPGWVKHMSLGILIIGEYDGLYTDRIKIFESIVKKAGIEFVASKNIQSDRWKKYIWNCTFNIICAITGFSVDKILQDEYLQQLCIDTMREILQIAKKENINLDEEEVMGSSLDLAKKLGHFKPSTLEDIEKGKPIELDAFTGTVISLAKKHNLPIPVNKVLYALLQAKQIH